MADAQPGCAIVGILGSKEADASTPWQLAAFRVDHRLGVVGIFLRGLEVDASDRVLHRELGLEIEGNRLRAADDHQIVGHDRRIGRTWAGAVSSEKIRLALAAPVGGLAFVDPEELAGLLAAQLHQRLYGFADSGIDVGGENHSPTRLFQPSGIHPFADVSVGSRLRRHPPPELRDVGGSGLLAQKASQLFAIHWRQSIGAGGAVDAVEKEQIVKLGHDLELRESSAGGPA